MSLHRYDAVDIQIELGKHHNPCGGTSLRNLRRALGFSQLDFADMLGMNQVSLSMLEREDREPKQRLPHMLIFTMLVATWRLSANQIRHVGELAMEVRRTYGWGACIGVLVSAGQWSPGKASMPWPPPVVDLGERRKQKRKKR